MRFDIQPRTGRTFDGRVDSRIVEGSSTPQIHVVTIDISEQEESQRAFLEKDKYLRSLGDALPVLIGYLDSALKYQFANAAHGDWFGVAADTLVGQPIQDVFGPDSSAELADYLVDVLSGCRVDFEMNLQHCEKGSRQVQIGTRLCHKR